MTDKNRSFGLAFAFRVIFLIFSTLLTSPAAFAYPANLTNGFDSASEDEKSAQDKWLFYEIRQSGDLKGYIFGGMHTLIDVNALPEKIKNALEKSSSLVLESNYFDTELTHQAAKALSTNPMGEPLEKRLLPATYANLQSLYEFENVPKETQLGMDLWNPYMVVTILEGRCVTMELKGILAEKIIDDFAVKRNMNIVGMENLEDQLGWLNKLSQQEWDTLILAYKKWITDKDCSSKFAASYKKISVDLVSGNLDALFEEYKRFYSQDVSIWWFHENYFMVARNVPLSKKMIDVMHHEQLPFFSMGAAHLGGPEGILALLRSNGYEVVQQ